MTINATLTLEDEAFDDGTYERGADVKVPGDTDPRAVLRILFAGFEDQLRAAGIQVTASTQFT
jgi:hypothetical protein